MIFNDSKFNHNWNIKELNQLGEFKRGKSKHRPRNDIALFTGGKYPLIQTGEIKEANLYIRKHTEMYNDFGLKQSKLWNEGTLCITIAANIAETALLGYPMCFPDSVVGFTAYPKESSELFMHYVFEYIKEKIQNSVSGSIQDNINIDYLTGLTFRIPEKSYQDKIAAVLSALDAKIELNARINAELESMAKTLYDYWFVQFAYPHPSSPKWDMEALQNSQNSPVPFGGGAREAGGGGLVWNEALKREIPLGWEVKLLADWIESDKSGDWGKDEPEGNYIKKVSCIRGTDINGLNGTDTCNPPTRFILEKNSHKILNSHDLIIEISGGAPKQSTGRLGFITDAALKRFENPLICSNFCKAISLKDKKYLYNFVYHWNMLYDNDVFFGYEGKTSGIKNLLFDSFVNSHWTVIPPRELVDQFYDFMQKIQSQKHTLLLESQTLTELRDWLLPMLMNGQIQPPLS